jgi:hypothetical protein
MTKHKSIPDPLRPILDNYYTTSPDSYFAKIVDGEQKSLNKDMPHCGYSIGIIFIQQLIISK